MDSTTAVILFTGILMIGILYLGLDAIKDAGKIKNDNGTVFDAFTYDPFKNKENYKEEEDEK